MGTNEDKNFIRKRINSILGILLYGIPFIIFLVLSLMSRTNDFLLTVNGKILTSSFLFIFLLLIIFFRKEQLHFVTSIYLTLSSFLFCYGKLFMPDQYFALSCLLFSLFGMVIYLIRKKYDEGANLSSIASLFFMVPLLFICLKVGFENATIFFYIAIPISVLSGGIYSYYHFKDLKKNIGQNSQKQSKSEQIAIKSLKICGILLISYSLSFVGLESANVALDFKEKEIIKCEVKDKFISDRLKSPRYYKIKIRVDEEDYSIAIPLDVYKNIDVGDMIEVKYCKGLFNVPYYIY